MLTDSASPPAIPSGLSTRSGRRVRFPEYLGVQRSQRGVANPRSQDSLLPTHHLVINTGTDSRVKWWVENFSQCVWRVVSAASKRQAIYSVYAEKCLRVCTVCREIHTNNNLSGNHMCLATVPQPLPKRVLQRVRSGGFSFNYQYFLVSKRSRSSSLHLLPRLFNPSIFPSMTCCRRRFLRKKWPVQLAFHCYVVYRMFLPSLTFRNSSFFTWSAQTILSSFLQYHV